MSSSVPESEVWASETAEGLHLPEYELTSTPLISYFVLFFSYVASGMIGQAIGRRRFS